MRAAVFYKAGKPLVVEAVDDPKPNADQVIIKVHRCGICGTDVHSTSGHGWDFPSGSIIGHEFVGEIVELGNKVEGLKKGEVITAPPLATCGQCEACIRGATTMCVKLQGQMGGCGEYMAVAARTAVRLPSTFTPADGALVEPFAIALNGLRQAAIKPGERVLVLGGGSVAVTTIFWAKRFGASRVVAVSRSPRRAQMTLAMGADKFVPSGENEVPEVVEALGGAPDVVFECAGAPGLLAQAVQHVAPFGHIVSMGFCTAPDALVPALVAMKSVRLSFPMGYSPGGFEYVADNMLSGKIDPKAIISSVVSLDELPSAFEALRGLNNETKMHVTLA
jgi:(R,R)-butanediol dehydrogenase/meso-butanediol dehydrogenase/diacetyl reductase